MDNIIKCPFCGREHSILNKDGKLRTEIHCRCKSKKYKYHIVITWFSGIGYQIFTDDMQFIDIL